MKIFKNKTLLITGGTGSFGNALLKNLLSSDTVKEYRIFSRDEKKQDDMRKIYKNKKIKFYIGDVRDYNSIRSAMRGVDYVFHAAALKQVPSCEFYPLEATKTNVIGTDNVLEAAIIEKVRRVICLSTDKAVYPINAMGISKALMEKVALSKARNSPETTICVTRYGNVMASRGSVIPLFVKQIKEKLPLTITDPKMTRFMMTLDEAVKLVLYAFENGKSGEIFIQKSPGATIEDIAKTILKIFNVEKNINIIGTRHGEKLYESLISREEMSIASDLGDYYKIVPDLRDLNYEKYIETGKADISSYEEYTSHNTLRLSLKDLELLIKSININKL